MIYCAVYSAIDTIIKKGALSDVQRGRSFKKYTSRVHVADICNALNESIHKPSPGYVFIALGSLGLFNLNDTE
jgi:hypothetical protein